MAYIQRRVAHYFGPRAEQSNMHRLGAAAVFREYRRASAEGADSGVIGFNGSVNPSSTNTLLRESGANDETIFDFGAGDGKFLISAAAIGAKQRIGVEYADNIGHKLLFDAVVQRIERSHNLSLSIEWVGNDIEQV
jgi:hypothetical protein